MKLDFMYLIAKNSIVFLGSFYIFAKINGDLSKIDKYYIYAVLLSCVSSVISSMFSIYFSTLVVVMFVGLFNGLMIAMFSKVKYDIAVTAMFVSMGISLVVFNISLMPAFVISHIVFRAGNLRFLSLVINIAFHGLLTFLIFKIRRFKNGFPFLKNKYAGLIGMIVAGGTLVFHALLSDVSDLVLFVCFFLGIFLCGISIFTWIKRSITQHYRNNLKEQTIKQLEEEIREKDKLIEKLRTENEIYLTAEHKINNRLKALEAADESLKDSILSIKNDYHNDTVLRIQRQPNIQLTDLPGIDVLLTYFYDESVSKGITYNVVVGCSVKHMIESTVPQGKLETLIGDHIKNAIIAIETGNLGIRRILIVFAVKDNCYEISFYDSGAEFDIAFFPVFGKKRITSHEDSGGNGVGMMTTFELTAEYRASFIITEKKPAPTDFTKKITVRFDGRGEYKIVSYRADEIIEICKGSEFPVVYPDSENHAISTSE